MKRNSSISDNVLEFTDLITNDVTQVLQLINYAILCSGISSFGILANTINIMVFIKHGFKDSINISLLGLAVADFASSTTMLWTSISYTPAFKNLDLPIVILEVVYVTGGWAHICFNRITSFITAFITLERCLCIAIPLKVKNIITPFRTKVINVFIFVSMISMFCPNYFVNKLDWRYDVSRNRTLLGIAFTSDREIVESVTFLIHSVILNTVFILTVAICTMILVVKLNEKTKWREKTTKHETTSVKDKKVVKMITFISSIFVICYVPPTINFLVMFCYPEFGINRRFHNLFYSVWSFSFVLEAINSSVNIVIYLKMSSKFKATLMKMFLMKKVLNKTTKKP